MQQEGKLRHCTVFSPGQERCEYSTRTSTRMYGSVVEFSFYCFFVRFRIKQCNKSTRTRKPYEQRTVREKTKKKVRVPYSTVRVVVWSTLATYCTDLEGTCRPRGQTLGDLVSDLVKNLQTYCTVQYSTVEYCTVL